MDANTGKRRGLVLLALSIAVIAAAVLAAERFHIRLDLTSDRSYSLSPVSRNLYKELPDRLHITYYRSPALSERHPGPRAVEDFLREFEAAGHGRISVSFEDPASNAGAVEGLGVIPQRMQVVEKNEQRVAVVYSGIVLQYLDRTETIPFTIGVETLEYDLVKAARRAVANEKPVVAVLIGDADKTWENDYRSLNEALSRSGWKIEQLKPGDETPVGTDVLLVLGNTTLDDYAAYRVDSYLASGGTALFAVRGVDVEARQSLTARPLEQDAMLRALETWGLRVKRELVLDPTSLTVPFQTPNPGGGASIKYIRYPHWIISRPENVDRNQPLTSRFSGLDLFWPSPLELAPPEGIEATPLVKTGAKAWLQTKDFAIAPEDEARFASESGTTTGQYILAATMAGKLPMAFAGKPVPAREGSAALPPLPAEAKPSRIVVVGSSDFASDLMTMTDSLFNAEFVANGTEWLGSGAELASLKSRGGRDPRLGRIEEPEKRNAAILLTYGVNLILVPGGLALYGIIRSRRRRKEGMLLSAAVADSPSEASGGPGEQKTGPDDGSEKKEGKAKGGSR